MAIYQNPWAFFLWIFLRVVRVWGLFPGPWGLNLCCDKKNSFLRDKSRLQIRKVLLPCCTREEGKLRAFRIGEQYKNEEENCKQVLSRTAIPKDQIMFHWKKTLPTKPCIY